MNSIADILKLISEYGAGPVMGCLGMYMWWREVNQHNATRDKWAEMLERKITSEVELRGTLAGLVDLLKVISHGGKL